MTITPTTTTTTTATTSKSAASTSDDSTTKASGALAADFQTFLTLLTTQMKNQDPLQPMESTEFISQLATFSGVEQQVRANDRLDSILAALSGGGTAGLAEWIGREVRVPTEAAYDGDPIEVAFEKTDGADKNVLTVTNAFGSVVATTTLAASATGATWDGTDDLGMPVADGDYTFTVQSYAGDTLVGTQQGSVYTTVKEVRMADGETRLIVGNGDEVSLDDVTAIR